MSRPWKLSLRRRRGRNRAHRVQHHCLQVLPQLHGTAFDRPDNARRRTEAGGTPRRSALSVLAQLHPEFCRLAPVRRRGRTSDFVLMSPGRRRRSGRPASVTPLRRLQGALVRHRQTITASLRRPAGTGARRSRSDAPAPRRRAARSCACGGVAFVVEGAPLRVRTALRGRCRRRAARRARRISSRRTTACASCRARS